MVLEYPNLSVILTPNRVQLSTDHWWTPQQLVSFDFASPLLLWFYHRSLPSSYLFFASPPQHPSLNQIKFNFNKTSSVQFQPDLFCNFDPIQSHFKFQYVLTLQIISNLLNLIKLHNVSPIFWIWSEFANPSLILSNLGPNLDPKSYILFIIIVLLNWHKNLLLHHSFYTFPHHAE